MRLTGLWWWIDRWRKSSAFRDMTLEQQGAYRNLLDDAALRGGPLPDDDRILGKASGDALAWKRLKAVILARFTLGPDGWRNETLDEVLRESERRAKKQKSYRDRDGNESGNSGGNGSGNGSGGINGNSAGNKQAPPDPDPILRITS